MISTGVEGSDFAANGRRSPSGLRLHSQLNNRIVWFGIWAPFVVLGLLHVGIDWFPLQDHAVLDLTTRDYLNGHPRLVGAFSRLEWNHPGPIWFLCLLPFRLILGQSGLIVGSLLWFGAGIATAVTLTRIRFGVFAGNAAIAFALIALLGSGAFTILHPWNPHLAWAWYPVFLVLGLSSVLGRTRDLWPAMFLGGLLIQLHISYIVLIGLPALMMFSIALIQNRKSLTSPTRRKLGRDGGTSTPHRIRQRHLAKFWLALTFLSWIPPLIQQLRNRSSGNLWMLANHFFSDPQLLPEDTAGIGYAFGIIGAVMKFPLIGLGGSGENLEAFTGNVIAESGWLIAVPVVAMILLVVAVYLLEKMIPTREFLFSLVVLTSGIVAVSQLSGERWPYLFSWRFVTVWFSIATMAVTLHGSLNRFRLHKSHAVVSNRNAAPSETARRGLENIPQRKNPRANITVVSMIIFGIVTVGFSIPPTGSELSLQYEGRSLHEQTINSDFAKSSAATGQIKIVRFGGVLEGIGDGLINSLDAEGWNIRVDDSEGYKYGDHRVLRTYAKSDNATSDTRTGDYSTIFVTEQSVATTLATTIANSHPIATLTPLSTEEERRIVDLQREVIDQLVSLDRSDLAEIVDSHLIELVLEEENIFLSSIGLPELARLNLKVLNSKSCRCAVTLVPNESPELLHLVAQRLH